MSLSVLLSETRQFVEAKFSCCRATLRMERLKDFKTTQEKDVLVGTLCSWIATILIESCTVVDSVNCMLSVGIDW